MQNLAGCANEQSELMGALLSAGLCECASFHHLLQQRTGYTRYTGQIIPCIGVSKVAPTALGLLTFVTITVIVNYVFAEKLIPHFHFIHVTSSTLGSEHKMGASFAYSFKVSLLKQTDKQIAQSVCNGQY